VIIVTAFGSQEARVQALRLGAVAFMEKPVPAPQLLERIQQTLRNDGA
jgi:DNA-binding response OmpR family regulator